MRTRLQDERGASAVEFAFILPLLLVLVLGIAEFGRAFQVQGTLSAAAREGVRMMALQNDPAAATSAVRNASGSLNPAVRVEDIDIALLDAAGNPTTVRTCPTTNAGTRSIRLTISYPMPYLTDFFGSGLELTGTGVMRCNG
jgi:Flp pilus assembly protein TadG